MAAPTSPAELAQDLLAVMTFVMRASGGEYFALVAELDMTIPHFKMLHWLDCSERELSVKELSERLGLSLPATSRNVEALLQRGYVERREDERDRRVRRLCITPLGREIVMQLDRARLSGLEQFAGSLSETERRNLHVLLAPIAARAAVCGDPTTADVAAADSPSPSPTPGPAAA
jgi:DNA-binding MarR family transcriptional regulator